MNVAEGLVWYLVFLFSTTAHEAAHAAAALLGGDLTAYRAGQVTLNPIPHVRREPIGMIVMPLLAISNGWCIGWASTPYDPSWAERYPRRAAWMAAAGPGANLVLALLAFTLLRAGLLNGIFSVPELLGFSRLVAADSAGWTGAGQVLSVLLTLNVLLFVLNLVPISPFDGASAATLLLPEHWGHEFRRLTAHRAFAFFVFVGVFLFFGQVFRPIFFTIVRLVHPEHSFG